MRSDDDRTREKDPFLLRIAEAVEFTFGVLTSEFGFVVLALLVALVLGASLIGLLLEFVVGAAVLGAVGVLVYFFSGDS